MTDDFYDLLDVPSDASQDEIKKAFRKQVRIYHPDLNDDDRAQAQFTALKKAYDILGDPVERRAYDRLGHETYVAKRTSGLPSADQWSTSASSSSSSSSASAASASSGGETTDSASSTERTSGTAGATDANAETDASDSSSAGRTSANANATGSARASGAGHGRASASGSAAGSAGSSAAGASAGTAAGAGGAGTATGRSSPEPAAESGVFDAALRWWRNRKVALPLLWLSALTYLVGLGHFGAENEAALRSLSSELAAVGADPSALWTTLTEGRHGIDTVADFVATAELLAPPLEPTLWYGALAGLVALALLAALAARVFWRLDAWGPVTINETLVLALALGVSSALVGGPLLAGTLLMPLLFGVIVHRTRALPGWAPSYAFVLAVCVPGVALAASAAGHGHLGTDLLAFVAIPLLGAFGLPIRFSIRKRFGR